MNSLPDDQNFKPNLSSTTTATPSLADDQPAEFGSVHKETELSIHPEKPLVEEAPLDVEISPEVEAAGVQKHSDTITLPPDVTQLGVEAIGPAQPHGLGTTVKLPLDDTQIIQGLHAQIFSSLRWLAEWCFRQLKKAHIHLRVIAGRIERVRN